MYLVNVLSYIGYATPTGHKLDLKKKKVLRARGVQQQCRRILRDRVILSDIHGVL